MLTTILFQIWRGIDISPETSAVRAVASEDPGGASCFSFRITVDDEDARSRAEDVLCSRPGEDIPTRVVLMRKHNQPPGYQQPKTVDAYEGRVSFNADVPACAGRDLVFTLTGVRRIKIWE